MAWLYLAMAMFNGQFHWDHRLSNRSQSLSFNRFNIHQLWHPTTPYDSQVSGATYPPRILPLIFLRQCCSSSMGRKPAMSMEMSPSNSTSQSLFWWSRWCSGRGVDACLKAKHWLVVSIPLNILVNWDDSSQHMKKKK